VAPSTRFTAAETLRLYLPPAIQGFPLAKLSPRLFQELYNGLTEVGRAPGTVSHLHRILKTRLNKAVALGHLAVNTLASVRAPAPKHREYRVFTPEEARLFLEEAEREGFAALWILLLLTGLRPEQALGLKWEDLDGNKVRVRRALVRVPKEPWQLAPTKPKRERAVSLPATAVRALMRHRAKQAASKLPLGAEYSAHGLIFASTVGERLFWENVVLRGFRPVLERVAFRLLSQAPARVVRKGTRRTELAGVFKAQREAARVALEKTGLDRMWPYDLRHSAATLLLAAGDYPKVVSERLGHSKVTLTLDTYSNVLPGLEEKAAERLENVILGNRAALGLG
jgi:integrase